MALLVHEGFEFKNILSKGYKIKEDEPDVIVKVKMSDGSEKRNYGDMPKTYITVKFGKLDKNTYKEYMSHFSKNEDYYSYFSLKEQKMKTKKFFVILPEIAVENINQNHIYDEFEVKLEQCEEENV